MKWNRLFFHQNTRDTIAIIIRQNLVCIAENENIHIVGVGKFLLEYYELIYALHPELVVPK